MHLKLLSAFKATETFFYLNRPNCLFEFSRLNHVQVSDDISWLDAQMIFRSCPHIDIRKLERWSLALYLAYHLVSWRWQKYPYSILHCVVNLIIRYFKLSDNNPLLSVLNWTEFINLVYYCCMVNLRPEDFIQWNWSS